MDTKTYMMKLMVRDRIVVGIRNAALSEKLQLDDKLTLEKAITLVRQSEAVKEQQPLMQGSGELPMGKIHSKTNAKQLPKNRTKSKNKSSTCSRCGKSPAHDREHCPARDAVCRRCTKRGHYQAVCHSPVKVGELHSQNDVFLGQVGNQNNSP